MRKEKIKFNNRGKRKLHLEKISTNTADYENHSEPLRQHRRLVESGDFEEKDSERTEKLIQLLNNIQKQYFTFRTVFFSYRLFKISFSVLIKRGYNFNRIELSSISSQILNHLISNTRLKY